MVVNVAENNYVVKECNLLEFQLRYVPIPITFRVQCRSEM
jgi:hypothetical protein